MSQMRKGRLFEPKQKLLGPTTFARNKIVFFRIQYETKVGNKWYPVVRYDTSLGFVHRDRMDLKGTVMKIPLFNQDYNDALTFAESDLKLNWEYYKGKLLEDQNE
jgi:hypothetical protein